MAKPKNHCFRWLKAPVSHDHVKHSNNNYNNNKDYGLPGKPWWNLRVICFKTLTSPLKCLCYYMTREI